MFTMLVAGCFSDAATPQNDCTPGMEGCACVDLQCEQGLMCLGGACVLGEGTGTTTDTTIDPSNVTGVTSGSTTGATTSADSTSSADSTASADSSSGDTSSQTSDSSSSTGEPGVCGDFNLDADEQCDQDNFCTDCELDDHGCNPLNNFPCPENRKCSFTVVSEDPYEANYTCTQKEDEPLEDGAGDCFVGGDAADPACGERLGCLSASVLDGCGDQGCCTEYCNLDLAEEDQCTNPLYTCRHEDFVLPGLEVLGICRL